ncbi:MAG: DUF192 domain-containing protein [Candidatus Gastranaerophilales bacterium]|nr:DUF192 domain-containing protein [Candidatus Gastranaerophilales bacterium]
MQYKGLKNTSKIVALCLVTAFIAVAASCLAFKANENNYAIIKGRKIYLEIADTPEKQFKGLMHIKQLPENHGMIFLFNKAEPRSFWMKNMEMPIDIIFLRNRKIITIHRNIQPDNGGKLYPSAYKSDCAIEVNAGFCDKYNVQEGDFILLSVNVKELWGRIKQSE